MMPPFNIHTSDEVYDRYLKDMMYKELMAAKMAERKLEQALIKEAKIANSHHDVFLKETPQDIVVRMLKGDFRRVVGVSFEEFIEAYHDLIENNPERLI